MADVTALVRQAGNGDYWGANVVARLGADMYAGWSLVIAYSAPSLPFRNLTIYDGWTFVSAGSPVVIPVSGFQAPLAGSVTTQISMVAYEGDYTPNGSDGCRLNGIALSSAVSPANDFFNSGNDYFGQHVMNRYPADLNMLGFDVKNIDASNIIPNGATSAEFTFFTNSDVYYPGIMGIAIDLYAPALMSSTKTVTNLSGHSPAQPGDTLQYTVRLVNSGQDPALNCSGSDPIPAGTEYLPGSLRLVDASGNTIKQLTDAPDNDVGEVTNGLVKVRLGTGADGLEGGTLGISNGSASFAFQVKVGVTAGGTTIKNTATLTYRTATTSTAATYDTPTTSTPVVQVADLSVSKVISPRTVTTGAPMSATIIVSNSGPNTATGIQVTDPMIDSFATSSWDVSGAPGTTCTTPTLSGVKTLVCNVPNLAKSQQAAIVVNGSLPANTPVSQTTLTDNAQVTHTTFDPDYSNNVSSDTVPVNQRADLVVTQTPSVTMVTPGQRVTYTVQMKNNGPSDATSVSLTDLVPPESSGILSVVSVTPNDPNLVCAPASATGTTCTMTRLAAGQTVTATVVAQTSPSAAVGSTITHNATVSSSTVDPDTTNNTVSTVGAIGVPSADMRMTMTASPSTATAGNTITYTLTATNWGPSDASGVNIADSMPVTLTNISATTDRGECTVVGQNVGCELGTMPASTTLGAAGATAVIRITGTVAPSAQGSTIATQALVSSSTADPDSSNNRPSLNTPLTTVAGVSVTKTASVTTFPANGDPVVYTLTVHNEGPSVARSVTLKDLIPTGLALDPAHPVTKPTGVTCDSALSVGDATHSAWNCSLGDIAPGSENDIVITLPLKATKDGADPMIETVTASSTTSDPNLVDNTASWALSGTPEADLGITQTADPEPFTAGTTATYELTVTNSGTNSSAPTVTDILPSGLTLVAAGQSGSQTSSTCTAGTSNPQIVTCSDPAPVPLAPGATRVYRLTVTVSPDVLDGTNLTNSAQVQGTTPEASLADNSTTLTTPVLASANLTVTNLWWQAYNGQGSQPTTPVASGLAVTPVGSLAWLTMDIANTGVSTARDSAVDVTFALPVTLAPMGDDVPVLIWNSDGTWTSDTARCSATQNELQCSLNNGTNGTALKPGNSVRLSVLVGILDDAVPGNGSATASVDTSTPESSLTDNSKTVPLTVIGGQSSLTMAKTAAAGPGPDGALIAGTGFSYTVQVSQQPDATRAAQGLFWTQANDVTVTDRLPSGLHATGASSTQGTCTIAPSDDTYVSCAVGSIPGTLNPDQPPPVTITITGTIDTGTTGPTITNTATGTTSSPSTGTAQASVTTPIESSADLRLFVYADPSDTLAPDGSPIFYAGSQVGYTLTAVNTGPSDAGTSTIVDTLPIGLHLDPGNSDSGCTVTTPGTATAGEVITCGVGALAYGQSQNLRVVATTSPLDIRESGTGPGCTTTPGCDTYPGYPRTLVNTATLTANSSTLIEADPTNNTESVTVVLESKADLTLAMSVDNQFPSAGSTATYTLIAGNNGPSAADETHIQATFPAGFSPVSVTAPGLDCSWTSAGTPAVSSLDCVQTPDSPWYQTFLPGTTLAATVVMQIPADEPLAAVTATGTISSQTPEANPADNTASVDVTAQQISDLSLTKTSVGTGTDPLVTGYPAVYQLSVTNAGPSVARSTTINDPLAPGLIFVSGTTSSGGICTQVNDPDAGSVVQCGMGDLAVGQTATATLNTKVDPHTNMTRICNTATTGSSSRDPVSANNTSTACKDVQVPAATDVGLTMTPQDTLSYPNGEVGFTATLTNNGPAMSTETKLTVQIPPGLTSVTGLLASASPGLTPDQTCTVASGQITCLVGDLDVGQSVSYDLIGIAPGPAGTTYTMKGLASHREADPDFTNDQANASVDVVDVPDPAVEVSKAVSPTSSVVPAGTVLNYTLTFTNVALYDEVIDHIDDLSGVLDDADVSNIVVTGPLDAQLLANGDLLVTGTLGRHTTATVTYTATVKPDGERGDSQVFNALFPADTAVGDRPNPSTPAASCPDCTLTNVAGLGVVKSASPTSVGLPQDPVTYSFEVTNLGALPVGSIVVNDSGFSGTGTLSTPSCPVTSLDPGASTTCTATYEVTNADLTAGLVTNNVTVSGVAGSLAVTSLPDSAQVTVRPPTDLSVSVTPDDQEVYPDAEAGFSAVVTNEGSATASGTTLSFPIPAGVIDLTGTVVTASGGTSPATTCTQTLGTMICQIGDLGPGQSVSYDFLGTASGPAGTTYTITASVLHAEVDTDPSNNTASTVIDVVPVPVPDLQVTKTVSPAGALLMAGTQLTYTITATNAGTATGVLDYIDDLSGVLDDAAMGEIQPSAGLTVHLYPNNDMIIQGSLEPDQTETVTYTVTIKPDGQRGDSKLFNDVFAADTPADERPDPANPPEDCPACTMTGTAGLTVVSSADPTEVSTPGDTIHYQFVVTNAGSVQLTDIAVASTQFSGTGTEPPISCPETTLDPGASTTCTASYPVTVADLRTPWIVNTVQATGSAGSVDVTSQTDSSSVATAPETDVSVTMRSGQTQVYPDSEVGFTATVTNNGPADATGVSVTVDIPVGIQDPSGVLSTSSDGLTRDADCTLTSGQLVCSVGELGVGQSVSYDILGTAAGPEGSVHTLTATVSMDETDTNTSNDSDSASVTVVPVPTADLQVTKTVSPQGAILIAGTVLTYTITLHNAGTAIAYVDYVDDLSGVVDDATVGNIVTDDSVEASIFAGQNLIISTEVLPGQTKTVTYDATLKPDGERGDSVVFNALSRADIPPSERPTPGTPPEDCPTCTTNPVAGLDLVKTANVSEVKLPGDQIEYSFAVTNAGSIAVSDVAIAESSFSGTGTLPAASCAQTSLDPGASTTCTATYSVTAPDLKTAEIQNTATATAMVGTQMIRSAPSTASVTTAPESDIAITLGPASTEVYPDAEFGMTASVTNNGPTDATGVQATFDLPSGLVGMAGILASAPQGIAPAKTCQVTGEQMVCQIGDLDVGQTVTYDLIGWASGPEGQTYTVDAAVTHHEIDPVPSNDQAAAGLVVVPVPAADLKTSKTVSPEDSLGAAGDVLTYTLTFSNEGTAAGTVDYVDMMSGLLDDATVGPFQATGDLSAYLYSNNDMIVTGSLEPGETQTVTYTATVKPDGTRGDSILFNALVSADTPPEFRPTPTTPPDQCPTCTLTQVAGLGIVTTATPASVGMPGETINYRYQVTNVGAVPVTGLSIGEDSFSGSAALAAASCPVTSLDPGASTVCTATYTVSAQDIGAQSIENTATVSGKVGTATVTSEPSSATVAVRAPTDVEVSVTPGQMRVYPDGQAGFTATVTNNGPGDATAVSATVSLPAGLSAVTGVLASSSDGVARDASCVQVGAQLICSVGALAAGESVSYDITATAAGPAGKSYTLNTSVTHRELDADPSNDQAAFQIQVVPVPDPAVVVTKTVSPADAILVGGTQLTYTITMTNVGLFAADVDHVDILAGVLDDATLDGIEASPGIETHLIDQQLFITGSLQSEETATVTYTVTVKDDGQRGDSVIFNDVVPADTPAEDRPDPFNPPQDCPTCTNTQVAGLGVSASVDPGAMTQPGQAAYRFLVSNLGTVPVNDVAVDVSSFTGGGSLSAITCPNTSLDPGQEMTCVATYDVTATDLLNPDISLTATVTGNAGAGGAVAVRSDPSTAVLYANPATNVSVTVGEPKTQVYSGAEFGISATVTNNGPTIATGVTLTTAIPDGLINVVGLLSDPPDDTAPDASCTIVAQDLVCHIGTMNVGESVVYDIIGVALGTAGDTYMLTPVVTYNEPDTSTGTDQAQAEIDVIEAPNPAIAVTKSVSPAGAIVQAGSVLTYTLTLTNVSLYATTVDHIDDLSRVAEDATIGAITVNGPVDAHLYANNHLIMTGTLARGQTATVTYSVTIKPDGERGSGAVFNAVFSADTGPGDQPDPDNPPADCPTCTTTGVAGLGLAITSDPTTATSPGDEVTYQYTVTNLGTVPVDDISVEQGPFSGTGTAPEVTCPATSLDPGQSMACTATYAVTAGDLTANTISNSARVSGTVQGGQVVASSTQTALVQMAPVADIGVVLSPSTVQIYPDSEAGLSAVVTNNGSTPATQVTVTIDVPAGMENATGLLSSASDGLSPASSCVSQGAQLVCSVGDLAPGQSVRYDILGRVNEPAGTSLTVNAAATMHEFDTATSDNDASATIDVVAKDTADLTVTKTVSPANAVLKAGTVLTYTVTLANTGTAPAVVNHIDDLSNVVDDADVGPITTTGGLIATQYANDDMIITGTLAPGQSGTVSYQATIKPDGQRGDSVLFNDVVTADTPKEDRPTPDTPPADCAACTTGDIINNLPTDVGVTMSPATTEVYPGAEVGIVASVTNHGPAPATQVVLTLDVPSGLVGVSVAAATVPAGASPGPCVADAGQWVCPIGDLEPGQTVSFDILGTAAQIEGLSYTVTGTVTQHEDDTNMANNHAQSVIDVVAMPVPDLSVTKTVNPTGNLLVAGATLAYTITFTNTGTGPAVVDHVDDLSAVLDDATIGTVHTTGGLTAHVYINQDMIITGSVAPGQTETVTYTVTIKPDGQRGDSLLFNDVVAANTPVEDRPDPLTPPDECPACTTTGVVGLGLGQSATPTLVSRVGDTITFQYAVINMGTVPIDDISIVDNSFSGAGTLSSASCPSTSLDAGAFMMCTATYTVVAGDISASQITNTVTAIGKVGVFQVSSRPSTYQVEVNPNATPTGPTETPTGPTETPTGPTETTTSARTGTPSGTVTLNPTRTGTGTPGESSTPTRTGTGTPGGPTTTGTPGGPTTSPTAPTSGITATGTPGGTGTSTLNPTRTGTGTPGGSGTPVRTGTGTPGGPTTGMTQTGTPGGPTTGMTQTGTPGGTGTSTLNPTRTGTGTPGGTSTPTRTGTGTPGGPTTGMTQTGSPGGTSTSTVNPTRSGTGTPGASGGPGSSGSPGASGNPGQSPTSQPGITPGSGQSGQTASAGYVPTGGQVSSDTSVAWILRLALSMMVVVGGLGILRRHRTTRHSRRP